MARLIDADALVKEAGRLWEEMPDGEELSKELMKAINHAPTVELTDEAAIEHLQDSGWMQNHDREMSRPHWISVKDRLPEDNTDYLCYFGDHPLWPSIGIAPWRGERGFYSIEAQRPIPYITHWMKLPLPPKHQEEQKNDKA